MRKFFKILCLALIVTFAVPPQAEAIDPVTLAILAPMAMKVAEAAKPYIFRGLLNGAKCMFKMGKDVFEFIYFPYGLCKMTFGAPFGGFRSGFFYMVRGGIAPAKLLVHTLIFPLVLFGLQINI